MKEMVIQGKTLIMDDEDYAFLKDKCIDFRCVNGVYYPVVNLHRMHFKDLAEDIIVDHVNKNTFDFRTSNLIIPDKERTMIVDQKCVDIVKDFEGFRARPYLDAVGIPTIGYGSTFYADGTKVTLKDPPISESEAENLTRLVLNTMAKQVNSLVSVELSTNQFSALVSFTYNVGLGAFKASTLRRLINEGAYDKAPEQFMRWNKAGGKVLAGLTRRRKAEVDLWNLT